MSVYIIAEAGVNHNGDLNLAKKLVDMAKECGADAIKFQIFKAEESTSAGAEKAEYQKCDDDHESQIDMIRRLELPFEDFVKLKNYSEECGIDFMATPDGIESLKHLMQMDVSLIKVGSTEVTNLHFLAEIAKTKKQIILSTGMSTLGEVENAIDVMENNGNRNITLMHCTTDYPTEIEDVNLKAMQTLHCAFKVPVGYSDHTMGIEAAVAAVVLGATCIEKHITLDKKMPGPDHKASMSPLEFKKYVQAIRNTEKLLGDGKKKPTANEIQNISQIRRSILAARDLKAGTILTSDMLCYKRPGIGIEPKYDEILIGRELKRDIAKEELISWKDV